MWRQLIDWNDYWRKMRILAYWAGIGILAFGLVITAAKSDAEPDEYLPEVAQALSSDEVALAATAGNPCTPGSLVKRGQTNKPWVAITYDDGPDGKAHHVMNAFDANGESGDAEFFMVGNNALRNPAAAREVAARGYGISNHSMSHQYSPSLIASEIGRANQTLASITGVSPRYFRSPGLTQGSVIQQELARQGMCNIFADFDPRDWVSPRISAAQICANIRANAGPGSIILLHDGGTHAQTVLATQTCLFPTLRELGLEVVPLPQLLSGEEPLGTRIPAGGVIEIQAGQPFQTVVGQLTADGERGNGYLTAYPCSEGQPETSDLNYTANEPTTNLLVVRLDEQGKFCVSANVAATHIIYDQVAEVPAEVLPLHNAARKYDSRTSIGRLAAGQVIRLQLAGPNQVVIGQITSDQALQPGFITAFTCDQPMPPTSNLNYIPNKPSSNRYTAQANENGEICFYTLAETQLIVDQSAELDADPLSGSPVLLFDTKRLIDTRETGSALSAGGTLAVNVGSPNQTVFAQMTVDRSRGKGFGVLYPCNQGLPMASNLNFGPDRPRSSSTMVTSDSDGNVCAYVSEGTDVIIDEIAAASWASHAPVRLRDTRLDQNP